MPNPPYVLLFIDIVRFPSGNYDVEDDPSQLSQSSILGNLAGSEYGLHRFRVNYDT
jgi:hypothetical protein